MIMHDILGGEETWDHDWWLMRCGLLVYVSEDGALSPEIDFVGPSAGRDPRITCEGCKKTPGKKYVIDIEKKEPVLC